MANEVTVNAHLEYLDSEKTSAEMETSEAPFTVATKKVTKFKMNVATSEEAIPLADLAACGYAMFRNCDPTNFINLRVGTGGAIFARLDRDPDGDGRGGVALLKLGSGAQAPYAIADTGACQMEVMIIST